MKKGFTLMELLIVIALIGILVTMGVASYSTAQIKSRDSRRKVDMKVYQNALEQFYADQNSTYPADLSELTSTGTYLPAGVPTDPKPPPYPGYDYSQPVGLYYCVCAKMEGGLGNANTQCANMGSCGGTWQR